ncbi:flagellar biosynthesis protein FlgB [Rhodanobacter sp. FW510-R12]|uniref:flagellar basal body rod protein FlgB n=1 Tax=unclassified Rhodanobacter TaxID=2621553 RepID=UPI0007AA3F91|nr:MULTISPECIES: flagellar basal body rod protein FlgB [unclassified Rhodanobacter]KZC18150.1 flagellar biosynthesis protein FlgB [Rhodanobacter sp. FW104-R8]KZC25780.1 flagellar biosynthesis protein FlgB [Rhodanobacter sp. FW510-T8]KZC33543.1 flagellar biosynthesis protein FlgB [Rhodanobacter sp. FW510-R10]
MSLTPDNLFGIHTQALDLWQRRTEVLANNLANADTPGYLARDIDFRKVLAAAGGRPDGLPLQTTDSRQIGSAGQAADGLAYRVPTQPSMDGNTVDAQAEQAAFAANGVHYQASLSFITAQIRMLRTAITGGQG